MNTAREKHASSNPKKRSYGSTEESSDQHSADDYNQIKSVFKLMNKRLNISMF